jgi:hypothetical protein
MYHHTHLKSEFHKEIKKWATEGVTRGTSKAELSTGGGWRWLRDRN